MDSYLPLISALVGALIGAAASVITIIVQSHYQTKRDLTKEAIALALEDWKTRLAIITQEGGSAHPLAVFVQYHTKLIHLAAEGKITPEAIRGLNIEQEKLIRTLREIRDEFAAQNMERKREDG